MDFEMQACYEMGVCEQNYVILQQTQFKMKTCTYNDGFLDSCMLRLALDINVKDTFVSIYYLAQINIFEMKVLSFNEFNIYILILYFVVVTFF